MKVYRTTDFEQGSLAWDQIRLGKVTMSTIKDLMPKKRGYGVARQNIINRLVAEQLSGQPIRGAYTRAMERGHFMESWGIKAFTQKTGMQVELVSFVEHDDSRIGCSPDGFIRQDSILEIKSPGPERHIRNIVGNGLDDYRPQCQGNMWITGRSNCYLISWCPDVAEYPLHVVRIVRNETMIAEIEQAAFSAAIEVDSLVEKAKDVAIDGELTTIAQNAVYAWENVFSNELAGTVEA